MTSFDCKSNFHFFSLTVCLSNSKEDEESAMALGSFGLRLRRTQERMGKLKVSSALRRH